MIYLVSAEARVFTSPNIKQVSVAESLRLLSTLEVVGTDTETSGLSPWSDNLLLVQLGCKDFQVVIDTRTIDIMLYKDFLESDRLFLFWNAKFDLQWFFKYGIVIRKVYDGFLAEKLLWLGYPSGMHSLALKAAGENYLGIELDKSVRGKIIWSKTLSEDIIVYGAEDVAHLEDIKEAQRKKLEEKGLTVAIEMENQFVLPLAYTEWCGIKLDKEKWEAKMANDNLREATAKAACDSWLIENEPNSPYIIIDNQGYLFAENPFDLTPKVTLNWNSAKQLIPIFKKYGVNVEVEDKEKGGTKDSVDAKCLKPQADKCSLIPLYLEYREAAKVTSTYGKNFLDQINKNSGRIHTSYSQMGADTTRITSGGKDKSSGKEYVNLLNLPADAETRACFIAEEGNKWISIDYSGQETYLMASIANDEAIIKELTEGSGDIHSLTAYMSYSEIPRGTPIKDIKKLYHNLRQEAKGIEFAINYGGDANTISRNKGIPIEESTKIYNNYMSGFKGLKRYQDFRRKDWFDKGYILLNPITGHKAFIYDYDVLKKEAASFKEDGFWDYYRMMKVESPECDTVQKVKHFFKRKSASEKQSINYPIQATGSMCLRAALINFFNWICENNLFGKVKICVTPYDEINCEAPAEIAEEVAQRLYEDMVFAGSIFCTRCKLDADMSRLEDGTLPTYWIH